MKVAVITPYHQINSEFEHCLASVQQQTHDDVIHIIIGDGCSYSNPNNYSHLINIPLPININNYGDTPRSVGVVYAQALQMDAIVFLDSDNWYHPTHIEEAVKLHQRSGADLITSHRFLCQVDGQVMGPCKISNGVSFCDTNCLFITRRLFSEGGSWWLMAGKHHAIGDRVIWDRLLHAAHRVASTGKATVNYRTRFAWHYEQFGLQPPSDCKAGADIAMLSEELKAFKARAINRFKTFSESSAPS